MSTCLYDEEIGQCIGSANHQLQLMIHSVPPMQAQQEQQLAQGALQLQQCTVANDGSSQDQSQGATSVLPDCSFAVRQRQPLLSSNFSLLAHFTDNNSSTIRPLLSSSSLLREPVTLSSCSLYPSLILPSTSY